MKPIERIRNLHRFDQTFRFVGGLFIVIPAALGLGFLDETILRYPILPLQTDCQIHFHNFVVIQKMLQFLVSVV